MLECQLREYNLRVLVLVKNWLDMERYPGPGPVRIEGTVSVRWPDLTKGIFTGQLIPDS